jgi:prepilin-type N-terminal cleavage/methylation domain-containing protein
MSQRIKQAKPGFTLIELLVVIAVIGVLAAILIPAISAVRQIANESVATSNLRQIHAAILLSKNDSNGRFPAMKNYSWDGPQGGDSVAGSYPYMQEKLEPYFGPVREEGQVQEIFRNPVITAKGSPEWLLEPQHTHFRYNVMTAPGKNPTNNAKAILLFDVVWPDWPAEDLPYKHDGEPSIKIVRAAGAVEDMTYSTYIEKSGGSESPDSEFFAEGWE